MWPRSTAGPDSRAGVSSVGSMSQRLNGVAKAETAKVWWVRN